MNGKVALITGAAVGLGLGAPHRCFAAGRKTGRENRVRSRFLPAITGLEENCRAAESSAFAHLLPYVLQITDG